MPNNLPSPLDPRGGLEPYSPSPAPLAVRQPFADGHAGSAGSLNGVWRRVMSAIWRYKWLALTIVLVGAGVGYVLAESLVKPEYAVNARLWIDPSRQEGGQGPIQQGRMLDAGGWMDLLRSYTVIEPVVHEQRLHIEPRSRDLTRAAFLGLEVGETLRPGLYRLRIDSAGGAFALSDEAGTVLQRGSVGESVGAPLGFRWTPPTAVLQPGREVEFAVNRPRDVARNLASKIQIAGRDQGRFITLTLAGPNPEEITSTLTAVTNRFVDVAAELKRAQSRELTQLLEEQLAQAAAHLQSTEAALRSFRVATATMPSDRGMLQAPSLYDSHGGVSGDYFTLRVQREQLRRDRESIQEALSRGGAGSLSVAALEVVPSVRASSEMTRALDELAEKRAELRALRNQFTDEYVPVQRLSEQVQTLEAQSVPALASLMLREISQREREMDARLGRASSELRQIPQRTIEEARLARNVAISADLYRVLRERYETARLAAVSSMPEVQILDEAVTPSLPVNDKDGLRIFLMTLAVSIGLAVGAPVLLDRMDSRVRYPEQVTNDLGLPILGAVPHVASAKGKRRALGSGEGDSAAVEALREIRLNLTHAFGTAGPLMTTVTSAGAGDGKSFLTSNLALAFADLGYRTLIVDGDIRRGQLHRLLGVSRVPGLIDYLSGNAAREDIIQSTQYDSLDLIPCGTRMQAGPELLGSAAMSQLIRDLRADYDVILVDSPPLGAGVDPFLLSTLTGNAMMVVRTGRTDREFAMAKLDLLDRLPVRLLGAVLNDVPATGAYRYYSYVPGYEAEDESSEPLAEDRQIEPFMEDRWRSAAAISGKD
jgi:polysaccharide biosynthesis transport protein